jgi:hypothetical protein
VSCKIVLSTENKRKLGMIACERILLARWRLQSEAPNHRNAFGHAEKFSRKHKNRDCLWHLRHRAVEAYWIFSQPLSCDGCGSEITFENEQFRASIAEFGRAMARLREPYLH